MIPTSGYARSIDSAGPVCTVQESSRAEEMLPQSGIQFTNQERISYGNLRPTTELTTKKAEARLLLFPQ